MAAAPRPKLKTSLDAPNTDAGAMERLLLLETMTPARSDYNRTDSLQAMRIMRQTIENRLASPAQYGAPGATRETDVIAVGNQFAGFGSYPTLDANLASLLNQILKISGDAKDPRQPMFAQFVSDAITAATEAIAPSGPYADATAWRTQGRGSPGGRFRLLVTLQGNEFYATKPVPPLPVHHRHVVKHRNR